MSQDLQKTTPGKDQHLQQDTAARVQPRVETEAPLQAGGMTTQDASAQQTRDSYGGVPGIMMKAQDSAPIQLTPETRTVAGNNQVSEGNKSDTRHVSDKSGNMQVVSNPTTGGEKRNQGPGQGHLLVKQYPNEPRAVMFHRSGVRQYVGDIWWEICHSPELVTITDPLTKITKSEPLKDIMTRFCGTHADAHRIFFFHNGMFNVNKLGEDTFYKGDDETFQAGFEEASTMDQTTGVKDDPAQSLEWGKKGGIQKGLYAEDRGGKLVVNPDVVPAVGTITTLPFVLINGQITIDLGDDGKKPEEKAKGKDPEPEKGTGPVEPEQEKGGEPIKDESKLGPEKHIEPYVAREKMRIIPRENDGTKGMLHLSDVMPNFPISLCAPPMPSRFMFTRGEGGNEDKVYDVSVDYVNGHFRIAISIYPTEKHLYAVELGTSRVDFVLEGEPADEYMRTHFIKDPILKYRGATESWQKGLGEGEPDNKQAMNAAEEFWRREFEFYSTHYQMTIQNTSVNDSEQAIKIDHAFDLFKKCVAQCRTVSPKILQYMINHFRDIYTPSRGYDKRYSTYVNQLAELQELLKG